MSVSMRLAAARDAVEEFTQLGDDSSLIDELLDAYAHELAERIISDPKAAEVAYRPGLMWAAEVIDPQADRE